MIDDDSPIYQDDTGAPFAPQFLHKLDQSPVDLTGATITMKMQPEDGGTTITCIGPWTIDNASQGMAHYQYQSADVALAGVYKRFITITNSNGPVHADMKILEILPVS
jgi:BppU N-terminal domain